MSDHVLVLDEGTTSTRAVLFDSNSRPVNEAQKRISVSTPTHDRVEQDATEIADSSVEVLRAVIDRAQHEGRTIAALGIANQRTTTVLWDRVTGLPVAPVISWQDTRAAAFVAELGAEWAERVLQTTGMNLVACNVAVHLATLLQDAEIRRRAERGELLAGTPDTWMLWQLTGGGDDAVYASSFSNASCHGGYDLLSLTPWRPWLEALGLPENLFAEVRPDGDHYGTTAASVLGVELPIRAVIADQQSALFGHAGQVAGSVKCTHGTGSFVDFNLGADGAVLGAGFDTRGGWKTPDSTCYILEGSSFVTGSAVDWLVEGIGVLSSAGELDVVCSRTPDPAGLVCVPALAGFSAPYWDTTSRGVLLGLHRGTTNDHIVRATVNGVAETVAELVLTMSEVSGVEPEVIAADGGLARSDALLQAQADYTGVPVERAAQAEYVTARGAGWIAGVAGGVWSSVAEAVSTKQPGVLFEPAISDSVRAAHQDAWRDATQRALGWRPVTIAQEEA